MYKSLTNNELLLDDKFKLEITQHDCDEMFDCHIPEIGITYIASTITQAVSKGLDFVSKYLNKI